MSKDKTLSELRQLLHHLHGSRINDTDSRAIHCTPCGGNYGKVEAWVVAVEGSPARGTLFIGQNHYTGGDDVFYISDGRSKRIGAAQAEIVRRFEAAHLGKRHSMMSQVESLVIPGIRAGI